MCRHIYDHRGALVYDGQVRTPIGSPDTLSKQIFANFMQY